MSIFIHAHHISIYIVNILVNITDLVREYATRDLYIGEPRATSIIIVCDVKLSRHLGVYQTTAIILPYRVRGIYLLEIGQAVSY